MNNSNADRKYIRSLERILFFVIWKFGKEKLVNTSLGFNSHTAKFLGKYFKYSCLKICNIIEVYIFVRWLNPIYYHDTQSVKHLK